MKHFYKQQMEGLLNAILNYFFIIKMVPATNNGRGVLTHKNKY